MEFLGAEIADIFPIMKTNSRIYSFNNYKGRYYFPNCGISKPKASLSSQLTRLGDAVVDIVLKFVDLNDII